MCAGSAPGSYIRPFVVYKGKRFQLHYGHNLPVGGTFAMSETGYFNKDIFIEWLDHFQRFRPAGPALLVVDGHRSHVCEEVADYVEKLGILLLCLPSNTMHDLQPFDKAFFSPLKSNFDSEVQKHIRSNPGQSVAKGPRFEKIFVKAYEATARPRTMIRGFKVTGL